MERIQERAALAKHVASRSWLSLKDYRLQEAVKLFAFLPAAVEEYARVAADTTGTTCRQSLGTFELRDLTHADKVGWKALILMAAADITPTEATVEFYYEFGPYEDPETDAGSPYRRHVDNPRTDVTIFDEPRAMRVVSRVTPSEHFFDQLLVNCSMSGRKLSAIPPCRALPRARYADEDAQNAAVPRVMDAHGENGVIMYPPEWEIWRRNAELDGWI